MLELKSLLNSWKKRLQIFEFDLTVAKGMDSRVALGVADGRTKALKDCIKELEETIKTNVSDNF